MRRPLGEVEVGDWTFECRTLDLHQIRTEADRQDMLAEVEDLIEYREEHLARPVYDNWAEAWHAAGRP